MVAGRAGRPGQRGRAGAAPASPTGLPRRSASALRTYFEIGTGSSSPPFSPAPPPSALPRPRSAPASLPPSIGSPDSTGRHKSPAGLSLLGNKGKSY
ncbi:hypothetical protein E2C01_015707 [Portunus trituberculatus]|uniref:Uncharacterized protein n=1 Tax=Portunus trituberculatus TaxID=210409 RepID=A0A5B7DP41_PORTR|nr:hypothetical protein [Portunus trituberculatus]